MSVSLLSDWKYSVRPSKISITTFDRTHGPRQPPMVKWTRLRHLRRSHSRSYSSVGTGAWPRSVWPQQQPEAHTNRWPWRRGTLTVLPSARRTRLRRGAARSVAVTPDLLGREPAQLVGQ